MFPINSAEPPPRVVEGRNSNRQRTLLAGKIAFGEGPTVFDCGIRDLSSTGARIILKRGQFIPSKIDLIVIRNRIAYSGKIVWSKPPEFGMSFTGTYSLTDELPANVQYLKRVWTDYCL